MSGHQQLASTDCPEEGFDAFDLDGDGWLSLADLQKSAVQLDLEISEGDCATILQNRSDKMNGFISRDVWAKWMNLHE